MFKRNETSFEPSYKPDFAFCELGLTTIYVQKTILNPLSGVWEAVPVCSNSFLSTRFCTIRGLSMQYYKVKREASIARRVKAVRDETRATSRAHAEAGSHSTFDCHPFTSLSFNCNNMLRGFLLAPLLVAAVSAAQLAVQNARLTIDSAEGTQLVSETYVSTLAFHL